MELKSPARLELDSQDHGDEVRLAVREALLRRRREAHVPGLEEQAGHAPKVEVEASTSVPTPLVARVTERHVVATARRQSTVVPAEAAYAAAAENVEAAPGAAERNAQLDVAIERRNGHVRRLERT